MNDPTWLDYAGFAFNAVATSAGLVGLFLAIKAYKVGIKAYEVSAESFRVARGQNGRAIELSALRDLSMTIGDLLAEWTPGEKDLEPIPPKAFASLSLFPADELPAWNFLTKSRPISAVENLLVTHPTRGNSMRKLRAEGEVERHKIVGLFCSLLHSEVDAAMSKRME